MENSVEEWLASLGLEMHKLCARRPNISVDYLIEAADQVYHIRDTIKPLIVGREIYRIAKDLMGKKANPVRSRISELLENNALLSAEVSYVIVNYELKIKILETELYWSRMPWHQRLFSVGVYAEGGL